MGWVVFAIVLVVGGAVAYVVFNKKEGEGRTKTKHSGTLYNAAAKGDMETVQKMLERKAEVDEAGPDKKTPLHWAVQRGHEEVAGLLMSFGANVNAADKKGMTPLQLCCSNTTSRKSRDRFWRIAEQLISRGASVNGRNKGKATALYLAIRNDRHDMIDLLLENNANPNIKDVDDYSILFWARKSDRKDTIKKLIEAGAEE